MRSMIHSNPLATKTRRHEAHPTPILRCAFNTEGFALKGSSVRLRLDAEGPKGHRSGSEELEIHGFAFSLSVVLALLR